MMNKKIPAFTIMEVTVAMLLSAIVIGITYTCFHIISGSFFSFKSRQEKTARLSQFEHVLTRDLDHGQLVLYSADGWTIRGGGPAITYQVQPDQIIRLTTAADTFRFQATDLKRTFESNMISETGTGDEQNRLDELSFIILCDGQQFPYHYVKSYSSADLFNRPTYAGH